METDVAARRYFAVKISNEKRIRDVDVPHVLFPESVLSAFKFHVRVILPVIYAKSGIPREDPRRNYLFLLTKSGDVLDSSNVTATLRAYLKNFDSELRHITVMSVR